MFLFQFTYLLRLGIFSPPVLWWFCCCFSWFSTQCFCVGDIFLLCWASDSFPLSVLWFVAICHAPFLPCPPGPTFLIILTALHVVFFPPPVYKTPGFQHSVRSTSYFFSCYFLIWWNFSPISSVRTFFLMNKVCLAAYLPALLACIFILHLPVTFKNNPVVNLEAMWVTESLYWLKLQGIHLIPSSKMRFSGEKLPSVAFIKQSNLGCGILWSDLMPLSER